MEECRPFEKGLYEFLDSSYPELGRKVLEKKQLDDALRAELQKMLEEYEKKFAADREAAAV